MDVGARAVFIYNELLTSLHFSRGCARFPASSKRRNKGRGGKGRERGKEMEEHGARCNSRSRREKERLFLPIPTVVILLHERQPAPRQISRQNTVDKSSNEKSSVVEDVNRCLSASRNNEKSKERGKEPNKESK